MARVLVVLPTSSYRTADFVAAAERLGVELAVASEEPPPFELGDRFALIDCSDPHRAADVIVELADHSPIDAVVAADDAGVMVAALASERLGLAHHPSEAAAATRDKVSFRQTLAASEVPQPDFAVVAGDPHTDVGHLGYPLVLKPRTATASQGVLRVDRPDDLEDAVARVRAIAEGRGEVGALLAERFVAGREVALEGLVADGRLATLAVFDKPDTPEGPTFEETLLVTPSSLDPQQLDELNRITAAGVTAVGLTHGPVHAEARIDHDGRIYLLEVAARSIGGLCGRSLRFGLEGTSLEELILAAALGQPSRALRQPRASGVMMLPVPRSGVLDRVEGVEEVTAMAGITEVDITIPSGTRVAALPEGNRYLGFIFATGTGAESVTALLRQASAALKVHIS